MKSCSNNFTFYYFHIPDKRLFVDIYVDRINDDLRISVQALFSLMGIDKFVLVAHYFTKRTLEKSIKSLDKTRKGSGTVNNVNIMYFKHHFYEQHALSLPNSYPK